ncbi:MAG: ProQ/FinO family protein [Pseudomonadota bacterium]
MNTKETSTAPSPVHLARALLKQLQSDFVAFRDTLPLAIGIDKQILAKLPELDRKILRIALGLHTKSPRYMHVMAKATARFDLEGNQGEAVTDEHRNHAVLMLKERAKKEAEVRKARFVEQKAKANAERKAKEEEEAERKRSDKLQQLAAKFARK